MFRFPTLNPITIKGPFWSATGSVIKIDTAAVSAPLGSEQFRSFDVVSAQPPLGPKHFVPSAGPLLQPDNAGGSNGVATLPGGDTQLHFAQFSFPGASTWTSYTFSGTVRVNNGNGIAGLCVMSRIGAGSEVVRLLRCEAGTGSVNLIPFAPDNQNPPAANPQPGNRRSTPEFAANQTFRFAIEVRGANATPELDLRIKIFREGGSDPGFLHNAKLAAEEAGSVGLMWSGPGDKIFGDLQIQPTVNTADTQLLRRLFLASTPSGAGASAVLPPRSAIAVCRVKTVTLDGSTTLKWQSSATPDDSTVTEAQLQAGLTSGDLRLFVLQGTPENWLAPAPAAFTCVAGEIDLNRMSPTGDARTILFDRLDLKELDGAGEISALAVHSGGLSIEGRAQMPWQTERVPAAWLLGSGARFRLSIETSRLRRTHRTKLEAAWRSLNKQLNPRFPLFRDGAAITTAVANWVTLEAPDALSIPPVFVEWPAAPWTTSAAGVLNVEKGKMNVLLTDQQPYSAEAPPASLARVIPERITIAAESPTAGLTIKINPPAVIPGQPPPPRPVGPALTYRFTARPPSLPPAPAPAIPEETLSLENVELAYDPATTPQALRAQQGIATPEWDEKNPLATPVLWAFMPLEDGWAQLPVLNLTEQIYLDAGLFRDIPAELPVPLLQGAVSQGNDISRFPDENSWRVTVTDGAAISGTWTLSGDHGSMVVASVSLRIDAPRAVVEGLCWLSTGRPTVQDALPDLDNWVSGLRQVPLRTVDRARDVFPSPLIFPLQQMRFGSRTAQAKPGVDAGLTGYRYEYKADATALQTLVAASVLPSAADLFAQNRPLVWRRHPAQPMIQALPLTQNQEPPNYPAASRQLAPFELPTGSDSLPLGWSFEVPDATPPAAAARFASTATTLAAAQEWVAESDLPMASLSFPGLFADPHLTGPAGAFLPVSYRFDLPYVDEVHALAQTPKTEGGTPAAPSEEIVPLEREDLSLHWNRLSKRASLAAADAVRAFNGSSELHNLVEPLAFDGAALLDRVRGSNPKLLDADLEGLSGTFTSEQREFEILAGSMEARREDDGAYRDQRGLRRKGSGSSNNLLRTPVQLEVEASDSADEGREFVLVSMLQGATLEIDTATHWQFWFKDLPVTTSDNKFSRALAVSGKPGEVNDPEARSRKRNYRNGYEWRLGDAVGGEFSTIFGLHFYPLTLDAIELDGDDVKTVAVTGRLQLPLAQESELTEFPNAVRITFGRSDNALKMSAIEMVSAFGEWPLAMRGESASGLPRLIWRAPVFSRTATTARISFTAALRFYLMGEEWSVGGMAVSFPLSANRVTVTRNFTASGSLPSLGVKTVKVTLARDSSHAAGVTLSAQVGGTDRAGFGGEIDLDLLNPGGEPSTHDLSLFGKMPLDAASPAKTLLGPGTLQFSWTKLAAGTPADLQFLPGMHIQGPDGPGYAALTFTSGPPVAVAATPFDDSLPAVTVRHAFVEAVFQCRWGAFLQQGGTPGDFARVFGSSAGAITVGYTLQMREGATDESYAINGFLEVKDLVSWPAAMTLAGQPPVLTLPASGTATRLDHIRHTIRVLLNQHTIGQDVIRRSPASETPGALFTLAADKSWQFLAVVEHQLVEVSPTSLTRNSAAANLAKDVRWTAVQEVRLMRPKGVNSASAFLASLAGENAGNPGGGFARRGFGYLQPEMRQGLIDDLAGLTDQTLIVEASAAALDRGGQERDAGCRFACRHDATVSAQRRAAGDSGRAGGLRYRSRVGPGVDAAGDAVPGAAAKPRPGRTAGERVRRRTQPVPGGSDRGLPRGANGGGLAGPAGDGAHALGRLRSCFDSDVRFRHESGQSVRAPGFPFARGELRADADPARRAAPEIAAQRHRGIAGLAGPPEPSGRVATGISQRQPGARRYQRRPGVARQQPAGERGRRQLRFGHAASLRLVRDRRAGAGRRVAAGLRDRFRTACSGDGDSGGGGCRSGHQPCNQPVCRPGVCGRAEYIGTQTGGCRVTLPGGRVRASAIGGR